MTAILRNIYIATLNVALCTHWRMPAELLVMKRRRARYALVSVLYIYGSVTAAVHVNRSLVPRSYVHVLVS